MGYDVYSESVRKMGQYTDAEVQAGRAEMRTRVMEENLQLAASQSASKSFLTSQVYKNSVDPSFFDQFGKTSRWCGRLAREGSVRLSVQTVEGPLLDCRVRLAPRRVRLPYFRVARHVCLVFVSVCFGCPIFL